MAGKPKMFTEQQCKDTGIALGMPEDKSLHFYHYYNAQDWFFNSGLKIKNLKSAMWRWRNNGYRDKDKTKLFPMKGKTCSRQGCVLPAVYIDTSGYYDSYKCAEHLPEKVKAKYE